MEVGVSARSSYRRGRRSPLVGILMKSCPRMYKEITASLFGESQKWIVLSRSTRRRITSFACNSDVIVDIAELA